MVTGRTLLLADDSATIQKVVDLTFTDEGLEVITVSDGQQAIEKLEEIVPDIVLADVFMPGLNGYEATRRIRQQEWARSVIIVALTGWGQPGDKERSHAAGCDAHLVKPISLQDLETVFAG